MNTFKLNLRYRLAQNRLIDAAMKYGLADRKTIAQSHIVDELHTELQKRMGG